MPHVEKEPIESSELPNNILEVPRERTAEGRRQAALAYLVRSERATSAEEADKYLDNLNILKTKLLSGIRELVAAGYVTDSSQTRELPLVLCSGKLVTPADLDHISESDIDYADPNIWRLDVSARVCSTADEPERQRYALTEALRVATTGGEILLRPERGTTERLVAATLHRHLSEDERRFLLHDYFAARHALARNLHRCAEHVAALQEFIDPRWAALSSDTRTDSTHSDRGQCSDGT